MSDVSKMAALFEFLGWVIREDATAEARGAERSMLLTAAECKVALDELAVLLEEVRKLCEEALELHQQIDDATSLAEKIHDAALEKAAELFDKEASDWDARYQRLVNEPAGRDSFDLWNNYSRAVSSAHNNAKRIRDLKSSPTK